MAEYDGMVRFGRKQFRAVVVRTTVKVYLFVVPSTVINNLYIFKEKNIT